MAFQSCVEAKIRQRTFRSLHLVKGFQILLDRRTRRSSIVLTCRILFMGTNEEFSCCPDASGLFWSKQHLSIFDGFGMYWTTRFGLNLEAFSLLLLNFNKSSVKPRSWRVSELAMQDFHILSWDLWWSLNEKLSHWFLSDKRVSFQCSFGGTRCIFWSKCWFWWL